MLKGRRLLAALQRLVRRCVRGCGSPNRGSIDPATGRKGAGGSCRSGRRQCGVRIPGRGARRSAATAVATRAADGTTAVAADAGGAEDPRQREGSSSTRGEGGFAGE